MNYELGAFLGITLLCYWYMS